LEVNPLPGLTPGYSDLVLIAQGIGMEYDQLIAEIMAGGLRRMREKRREEREMEREREAQAKSGEGKERSDKEKPERNKEDKSKRPIVKPGGSNPASTSAPTPATAAQGSVRTPIRTANGSDRVATQAVDGVVDAAVVQATVTSSSTH